MTRVQVSNELLVWAIERSGKQRANLEHKFPKLDEWLSNKTQPTLNQLENFAKATTIPFGFLFLDRPPVEDLPIPYFRTGNPAPENISTNLLETVYTMQRRQDWLREYLVNEHNNHLSFVKSSRLGDNPEKVADSIREVLHLNNGWAAQCHTWSEALKRLQQAMENAGILVVANGVVGNNNRRKLDVSEFRGFVLVDKYAPLVFVNSADAKAAQMFTLTHELAHIWFGSSAAFDLRQMQPADDRIEQDCNKTAAEFLVPAIELQNYWDEARRTEEPFNAVARHFKISVLVAARRALDLKLVSRNMFLDFYKYYLQDERRKQKKASGGNFYATQGTRIGHRFARAVIIAVREGNLLYRNAYELTGLHGKTFDKFVSELENRGEL